MTVASHFENDDVPSVLSNATVGRSRFAFEDEIVNSQVYKNALRSSLTDSQHTTHRIDPPLSPQTTRSGDTRTFMELRGLKEEAATRPRDFLARLDSGDPEEKDQAILARRQQALQRAKSRSFSSSTLVKQSSAGSASARFDRSSPDEGIRSSLSSPRPARSRRAFSDRDKPILSFDSDLDIRSAIRLTSPVEADRAAPQYQANFERIRYLRCTLDPAIWDGLQRRPLRIIVLGPTACGKTSIAFRWIVGLTEMLDNDNPNATTRSPHIKTWSLLLPMDFRGLYKNMQASLSDVPSAVGLGDRGVHRLIREADCAVLCFDSSDIESFESCLEMVYQAPAY